VGHTNVKSLAKASLLSVALLIPLPATAQSGLPLISPTPSAIEPLRAEDRDSVTIEKSLYFLDPDGRYVIAPAGLYLVRAREDRHLVLIPGLGRQALVIQAHAVDHQEPIAEPIALAVAGLQSDDWQFVLLQPGGKALFAVGATTPMRLRSVEVPTLTSDRMQQALSKKTGQTAK
jgi:hypothetical protein